MAAVLVQLGVVCQRWSQTQGQTLKQLALGVWGRWAAAHASQAPPLELFMLV